VRAHGSRLPTLQGLMEKSSASMTAPFTLPTAQGAFAEAGMRVGGAEAAEEFLRSNAALYTNKAADTVVVELAAEDSADDAARLASFDAAVGRITDAVHKGTRGNYAALLTGAHGARGAHRKLAPVLMPAYLHTTPTLLTAQVVCLMLFIIFMSGFCCLFQLQTPKKFEEPKSS